MKLRLRCACFPQMIAHQFPISQQKPYPRMANVAPMAALRCE